MNPRTEGRAGSRQRAREDELGHDYGTVSSSSATPDCSSGRLVQQVKMRRMVGTANAQQNAVRVFSVAVVNQHVESFHVRNGERPSSVR